MHARNVSPLRIYALPGAARFTGFAFPPSVLNLGLHAHNRAHRPWSCNSVSNPSAILICANPISFTKINFKCSGISKPLHTRNTVPIISKALYPAFHNDDRLSVAPQMSALTHDWIIDFTTIGCGWSHTLKTFISALAKREKRNVRKGKVTKPNGEWFVFTSTHRLRFWNQRACFASYSTRSACHPLR